MNNADTKKGALLVAAVIILAIFSAFGGFKYYSLNKESKTTKATLDAQVSDLQTKIAAGEIEKKSLNDALYDAQNQNEYLSSRLKKLTGTVDDLQKLTKTDPELLKKYSKVYFLNENYTPKKLVDIDAEFLFDKNKPQQFLSDARIYLKNLLENAQDEGLNLKVLSAFRSFGTQAALKTRYTVTYGSGSANAFSADQGYSEHQLGTALDFTSPATGAGLDGFENTPEYAWLQANAYKYGFVLSYPKGNAYYQFEPWHWRFVGTDLARKLHNSNMNYYDMDQRDIDKYLINLFD